MDDRYMAGRRKEGATLAEIGRELRLSRQAVHQELMKRYGTTKFTSLLNRQQVSRIVGLAPSTIQEYQRRGIIKRAGAGSHRYLYNLTMVKAIQVFRHCKVCGGYIPPRRQKYCSDECYESARYRLKMDCRLRKLLGQPITASIDYVRNNKVEVSV